MKFPFFENAYTSRTHAISLDLVTCMLLAHSPVMMIYLSCIFQAIVKILLEIEQMNDYFDYALSSEHSRTHTHAHQLCDLMKSQIALNYDELVVGFGGMLTKSDEIQMKSS